MRAWMRSNRLSVLFFGVLFIALMVTSATLSGCKRGADGGKPRVVVTTTMLADVVREVGGERVEVQGLLKPGTDPHTYRMVPDDVKKIARSRMVVMNGLGLEGKMAEGMSSVGDAKVVEVGQGLTSLDDAGHPGNPDPHIWFDVGLWVQVVEAVRAALTEMDPQGEAYYRERALRYLTQLEALEGRVRKGVGCIPTHHRKLVTSHDAFQYFGKAYGVELRALQGVSTEDAVSSATMAAVVEYVREHKLPAIFVESSVSPKAIEAIKRETGVKIGGELYSDSVGPSGSGADTYIGMVDHNVGVLVEALGGVTMAQCIDGAAK
jgi:manganese/zinc/iron transport system substrate-binding protein